jgi:hypothetical protein
LLRTWILLEYPSLGGYFTSRIGNGQELLPEVRVVVLEVVQMKLLGKNSRIVLVATIAVLCLALTCSAASAGGTDPGKNIRILYVGHPGSDREKDFVDFLSKHFGTVAKGDLGAFKESQSNGYDVTIMDYDGDFLKAPRPNISQGFSHPILAVGAVGALVGRSLGLKTGYM